MEDILEWFNKSLLIKDSVDRITEFKKVFEAAQSNENFDLAGDAAYELAEEYNNVNYVDEAIITYLQASDFYNKTVNTRRLKDCYLNLGKLYSRKSEYEKAIEHFLDTLRLNKNDNDMAGQAAANNLIGFEYDKLRIFTQSRFHYEQALDIFRQLNDQAEICKSLAYIGNVYNFENKPGDAVGFLKESLEISESIGDPDLIINPLAVFISVYAKMRENQNALLYSSRAILLLDRISNPNMKINVLKSHGGLCVELGDFRNGIAYLKDALGLAETAQNKALLLIIHKLLSNAHETAGDIGNAFIHFKKYDELREETTGKEISFKAKHKEIQYELEESIKQKESAIQTIQTRETEFNKRLWEAEARSLSMKMDGHFVFNALQSIQNFLMNHKADDANEYLLKFSRLMRLILENSQHDFVPMKSDLMALELYMQLESLRMPNPMKYAFHIDEAIDPEQLAIPPLLLQPFVENAIWHGLHPKKTAGMIKISCSLQGKLLIFEIEDDGVGRSFIRDKGNIPGFKKESLGVKITEERIKILSESSQTPAGVDFEDLFDNENLPAGTRVRITIPFES